MAHHVVPNPQVNPHLLREPPDSHTVSRWLFETRRGQRYLLHAAIPKPGGAAAPVLYLLDGNAAFAALAPAALARHPDLAVVAIGYETENGFDFDARSRDYTPLPPHGRGFAENSPRLVRPSGGAAAFLAALENEILPHAEHRFPLDPTRRTLWGHSYGGLFALYVLCEAPNLFQALCVASPSLWWGDGMIFDALAAAPQTGPNLLLLRGSAEASPAIAASAVKDAFGRLEGLLHRPDRPNVAFAVIPDASHRETLDRSLPSALQLAARQ